jgi:hypothetical protein
METSLENTEDFTILGAKKSQPMQVEGEVYDLVISKQGCKRLMM